MKDWAEKHVVAYEGSRLHDTIGITVYECSKPKSKFALDHEGIFGRYKVNVKSFNDTPLINEELVFLNEEKNYCLWKQVTEIWWIGKCENVGENHGIAYMDDCDCPYDNSCTWQNYLNNDVLNMDVTYDHYNVIIFGGISFSTAAGADTNGLSSAVSFIFKRQMKRSSQILKLNLFFL